MGMGAATKTATWNGHVTAALDISRWPQNAGQKNPFDFMTTAGLGPLGFSSVWVILCVLWLLRPVCPALAIDEYGLMA